MKNQKINSFKYFSLFFAMIVLLLVAGCSGPTPTTPIVNSFLANPTTITAGESSNLSWSVTDAMTVAIDQSVGSVASTGTTAVSPVTTTTYTLTATNTAGSVTASVTVTVGAAFGSIDINSNPSGAKVYLDGVDTGQVTPIVLTNIDVGNHIVKMDKYHYKVWEDTAVMVNANQTTYLNPPLTYATTEIIYLQPAGSGGKDSIVTQNSPDNNYGNSGSLYTGYINIYKTYRAYLEFGLGTVPGNAKITSAYLKLFQDTSLGTGSFTVGLYQVTSGWEEGNITWNNQPTSSSEVEASCTVSTSSNVWRTWYYIGDLVQGWLDGSITNYGMLLKATTDETSLTMIAYYRSSDYTSDISKRPKLEIHYYIP